MTSSTNLRESWADWINFSKSQPPPTGTDFDFSLSVMLEARFPLTIFQVVLLAGEPGSAKRPRARVSRNLVPLKLATWITSNGVKPALTVTQPR